MPAGQHLLGGAKWAAEPYHFTFSGKELAGGDVEEKNNLRQDVTKMSTLFKGWLQELRGSNTRNVVSDVDYFTNLVKRPAMAIDDVFRLHERVFLSSCQEPYFIEVRFPLCTVVRVVFFINIAISSLSL